MTELSRLVINWSWAQHRLTPLDEELTGSLMEGRNKFDIISECKRRKIIQNKPPRLKCPRAPDMDSKNERSQWVKMGRKDASEQGTFNWLSRNNRVLNVWEQSDIDYVNNVWVPIVAICKQFLNTYIITIQLEIYCVLNFRSIPWRSRDRGRRMTAVRAAETGQRSKGSCITDEKKTTYNCL